MQDDLLPIILLAFRKKDGNITKGDGDGDGSEEIVAAEAEDTSH